MSETSAPANQYVAEIEAFYEGFLDMLNNRLMHDPNAFLDCYDEAAQRLFDLLAPREYSGELYASHWRKIAPFYSQSRTRIEGLQIRAAEEIAFASVIGHMAGQLAVGEPFDMTFRVTHGLTKRTGAWLIEHEHMSFPIDPATGVADYQSKPYDPAVGTWVDNGVVPRLS